MSFSVGDKAVHPAHGVAEITQIEERLIGSDKITFPTNRAWIKRSSFPLLDRLVFATTKCPDSRFEISGHTDSRGSAEYNLALSAARAQSVAEYLQRGGVAMDKMTIVGRGEDYPVADNKTAAGRATNRRIEIKILETGMAAN